MDPFTVTICLDSIYYGLVNVYQLSNALLPPSLYCHLRSITTFALLPPSLYCHLPTAWLHPLQHPPLDLPPPPHKLLLSCLLISCHCLCGVERKKRVTTSQELVVHWSVVSLKFSSFLWRSSSISSSCLKHVTEKTECNDEKKYEMIRHACFILLPSGHHRTENVIGASKWRYFWSTLLLPPSSATLNPVASGTCFSSLCAEEQH